MATRTGLKLFKKEDLAHKAVVGYSRFGEVRFAVHKIKGTGYALKMLRKASVVARKETQHVKDEKIILMFLKNPYTVKLDGVMQDAKHLYFVLEFCYGGTLARVLRDSGRLSNEKARLIAAQIVIFLEHAHSLGIAYRAICPDNIMFDADGFLKVVDFNAAKVFPKDEPMRAMSVVGSAQYQSPEMIQGRGHTTATDFWSLGVLIFEMLCGYSPFYDVAQLGVYQKILESDVTFPPFINQNARSVVEDFLQRDPSQRLGVKRDKTKLLSNPIRHHKWFKGIDWNAIKAKTFEPLWQPTIHGTDDLRYFQDVPEAEDPDETDALDVRAKDAFVDF